MVHVYEVRRHDEHRLGKRWSSSLVTSVAIAMEELK